MRANEKGPHQISNVEKDSPASYAGLRNDDLILKVNDINVVGERYNKTVALIKNESEKGRLKLEVVALHSSVVGVYGVVSCAVGVASGICTCRRRATSTQ